MLMIVLWWPNLLKTCKLCWIALWLHLWRLALLYQHQQNRGTLYQPAPGTPHKDPDLCIHGEPIKSVQNFTYLGCVISSDNSIDLEITRRKQGAASAFGALDARVRSQRGIKLATNCKLYRVLFFSYHVFSIQLRHTHCTEGI